MFELVRRAFGRGFARAGRKGASWQAPLGLVALSDPGRAAWSPRDPASLAREGFCRNPIVHRCVRLIAEAAANVPIEIRADGVPAPEHPLARMLNSPNSEQTGIDLREALFGALALSGNAFLELTGFGPDGPETGAALYALRPERMKIRPGPDGWPEAYEYRIDHRVAVYRRDPLTDRFPVLHLRSFSPVDDLLGHSPLEAAAQALDVHNAGAAWTKALIDNSAKPSGALVFQGPGTLSDEQYARLRSELTEAHSGPFNAGRPLVLEGGLDWKPMSFSPAEMDFLEARQAAGREIALAFGVPPLLLGFPGDATYANYKEANLAFWRLTILPLAAKVCAGLERFLAPHFPGDPVLRCALEAVPALALEREALWAQISAADFLTNDEKRALAGL